VISPTTVTIVWRRGSAGPITQRLEGQCDQVAGEIWTQEPPKFYQGAVQEMYCDLAGGRFPIRFGAETGQFLIVDQRGGKFCPHCGVELNNLTTGIHVVERNGTFKSVDSNCLPMYLQTGWSYQATEKGIAP
jgi:hypothetical protein